MSSETDLVSCDTKSIENLKPNDLKTEVECDHLWVNKAGAGYRENPVEVCAKCGMEV